MTMVQCRDFREPEAFSDGHNGGINNAERKVGLRLHESGHTPYNTHEGPIQLGDSSL
jgi:hypothetical protein